MSSGSPSEALTLLSLAEATPLDEFHSAEVYLRRGQLAFLVNRGRDAPSLLLKAAERFERLDPVLARDTYLEAVFAGLLAGRFAEGGGVRAVAQAIRRAPAVVSNWLVRREGSSPTVAPSAVVSAFSGLHVRFPAS